MMSRTRLGIESDFASFAKTPLVETVQMAIDVNRSNWPSAAGSLLR